MMQLGIHHQPFRHPSEWHHHSEQHGLVTKKSPVVCAWNRELSPKMGSFSAIFLGILIFNGKIWWQSESWEIFWVAMFKPRSWCEWCEWLPGYLVAGAETSRFLSFSVRIELRSQNSDSPALKTCCATSSHNQRTWTPLLFHLCNQRDSMSACSTKSMSDSTK